MILLGRRFDTADFEEGQLSRGGVPFPGRRERSNRPNWKLPGRITKRCATSADLSVASEPETDARGSIHWHALPQFLEPILDEGETGRR